MKKLFGMIAMLLFVAVAYAIETNTIEKENGVGFEQYEISPSFPGGDKAYADYIKNNMHYPEEAK